MRTFIIALSLAITALCAGCLAAYALLWFEFVA